MLEQELLDAGKHILQVFRLAKAVAFTRIDLEQVRHAVGAQPLHNGLRLVERYRRIGVAVENGDRIADLIGLKQRRSLAVNVAGLREPATTRPTPAMAAPTPNSGESGRVFSRSAVA